MIVRLFSCVLTVAVCLLWPSVTILTSCKKKDHIITNDTITTILKDTPPILPSLPIIPSPQKFSDSLVKTDIYFHDGLTDYVGYQGSYIFTYDATKRVRTIKDNFSVRKGDTIIYQYNYNGNIELPSNCIFYEKLAVLAGNYAFDTMYYQYDTAHRLVKDSVFMDMWGASPFDKMKNVRVYSYPDNSTIIINWISYSNGKRVEYRRDSLGTDASHNCRYWNIYFFTEGFIDQIGGAFTCRAMADVRSFTTLRNPFSDLNICGFPAFWLEKQARRKILGNQYYSAINKSNMLPIFLDQSSLSLIKDVWYHNWDEWKRGVAFNAMSISATPDNHRVKYPSKYSVTASNSIAYDYYEYRFTYK